MSNNININDNNWIDIVFENRNHAYGAYQIRKDSNRNSMLGILGMFTFLGVIFGSLVLGSLIKDKIFKAEANVVTIPKVNDFDKIVFVDQPILEDFEEKIKEFTKSIKFVDPIIVPDKQAITSPLASVEEIKNSTISTLTNTNGNEVPTTLGSEVGAGGTGIVETSEPKLTAEKMPIFPDGEQALLNFIYSNSKFTKDAIENNVSGTLYASFVVSETGEVIQEKIERGLGFGMDEMVLNVLKKIPDFIPAEQNGQKVKIRMNVPIKFVLR